MNDKFEEILIRRITPASDKAKKVLMIAATAAAVIAAVLFVNPIFFILAVALCVADYYVFPMFDLEYEYTYVNGDIDVDKIMAKSRRKKLGNYEIENLVVMGPTGCDAVKDYLSKGKMHDYTSLDPQKKSYTLVYQKDSDTDIIKVEIPDEVAMDMRRFGPRKVFLA